MLCFLRTDARAESLSFLFCKAAHHHNKVELTLLIVNANYVILAKQKHFYKKDFSYKQKKGLFAEWKA